MIRRVGLALGLGLMLAPSGCRLHTEQPPVQAEVKAPDFSLSAHDGATVSLGDLLEGGPAIIVFYRGHW